MFGWESMVRGGRDGRFSAKLKCVLAGRTGGGSTVSPVNVVRSRVGEPESVVQIRTNSLNMNWSRSCRARSRLAWNELSVAATLFLVGPIGRDALVSFRPKNLSLDLLYCD